MKKADFRLSGEVDSAVWVRYEDALDKLREGSIAWQLVREAINICCEQPGREQKPTRVSGPAWRGIA